MKYFVLSLVAMTLISMAGCKQPPAVVPIDTPPKVYDNSFKIDGGAFKNVKINFENVTTSSGAYSTGGKNTLVEIMGTNDTLSLEYQIFFEGNKVGNFALGTPADFMTINVGPKLDPTQTMNLSSNSGGVLKVTNYDVVGKKIAGTFGGVFNAAGPDYTISDGTFSCVRANDTP